MNKQGQKTLADLLAGRDRADCGVRLHEETGTMQCERCGIGWREGNGPPCFPSVTFLEMTQAATRARDDLMRMQRNGADLCGYQLRDMMAFAAMLRLFDMVTGDAKIGARITELGKAARARVAAEKTAPAQDEAEVATQ